MRCIDLQKKLMVFFCLEEEKEKRETYLVSLLEINRKITIENYNLSEGTKYLIKEAKNKLDWLVRDMWLIQEKDTLDDILGDWNEKFIVNCSPITLKNLYAELASETGGEKVRKYLKEKEEYGGCDKLVFYVKIDQLLPAQTEEEEEKEEEEKLDLYNKKIII